MKINIVYYEDWGYWAKHTVEKMVAEKQFKMIGVFVKDIIGLILIVAKCWKKFPLNFNDPLKEVRHRMEAIREFWNNV